jgi:hypothetical protein
LREDEAGQTRWISGADAQVATDLVHRIASGGNKLEFHWENVSLHTVADSGELPTADHVVIEKDRKEAQELLRRLKQTTQEQGARKNDQIAVIVIGSQTINLLTEVLFADLFNTQPFVESKRCHVPLYMQYREDAPDRPSCFGGSKKPFGWRGKGSMELYYRDDTGEWKHLSNKDSYCGIVLLITNPADTQITLVLFGFSGVGTQKIGALFFQKPECFWPLETSINGSRVGLFACDIAKNQSSSEARIHKVAL